jgi:hypothetical protein
MPPPLPPLPLGAECKIASQCGSNAHCSREYEGFPGGYCTRTCDESDPGSCGSNGACSELFFVPQLNNMDNTSRCFVRCSTQSDCRAGYSCVFAPPSNLSVCMPDPSNAGDCDPTAGDGTCTKARGGQGICFRYRLGTAKDGTCVGETCLLGAGTCPPDQFSSLQECVIVDLRQDGIAAPGDLHDKYVGGFCEFLGGAYLDADGGVTPVPDGVECHPNFGGLQMMHFPNICIDGDNCDLQVIDSTGDNLCHPVCYPDGPPDGGVLPDGGTFPPPCATTCKRIWGSNVNLGLCVPDAQDMGPADMDAGSSDAN